jgi:hypothetical protein
MNFDKIYEIIQTSDGFSRHFETYKAVKMTQEGRFKKKYFFYESGTGSYGWCSTYHMPILHDACQEEDFSQQQSQAQVLMDGVSVTLEVPGTKVDILGLKQ